MQPRRIQLFLILGVCAIALHFTIRLGNEGFRYFSLQGRAKARVKQWETVAVKNRFALKGIYAFEVKGKTWSGESTLSPPYHLNEMAALSALKEKAKQDWAVWYNLKNPQESALEKSFPIGLLVRALICYAVVIYFFCLCKRLVFV